MIAVLAIVGIITIFGVLVISVIETKRMQKGRPDIISGILEKNKNKAGE